MPLVATRGAASAQGFGEFAQQTAANYIEDVFSTWLYTGTGTSSSQTITNGIDLSTKGGLVWMKSRTSAYIHCLFDTARGNNVLLKTNSGGPQDSGYSSSFSFLSNGFSVNGSTDFNASGDNEVSWTFRKQPKFFDVVTWTGDGVAGRQIPHSLGSTPGCFFIKITNTTGVWSVWHRSLGSTGGFPDYMLLNLADAKYPGDASFVRSWDSTSFTVGAGGNFNASGNTYVAYLFAHNAGGFGLTGTDNVISCGSFTVSGNAATVNLGYEPQWLLIKSANSVSAWDLFDSMRGLQVSGNQPVLNANNSGAEFGTGSGVGVNVTSTGFATNGYLGNGDHIYIAIRRGPMKTPTTGTSVYNGITRTGTGAAANVTAGFAPDLLFYSPNLSGSSGYAIGWFDRLRGTSRRLVSNTTGGESNYGTDSVTEFGNTAVTLGVDSLSTGINFSGQPSVDWMLGRAPGFFDVVCAQGNYNGLSTPGTPHNLGVKPELVIQKSRNNATTWNVVDWNPSSQRRLILNSTAASDDISADLPQATSSVFYSYFNSTHNCVNYLFASCPGVSKVGSYTGTGALQTINCGFTGGARFVLIKRTDSTGDWWVYDSARGITSGNDPYMFLNVAAAEVTGTNYVDTTSVGFQVTAAAPAGINANGGSYIFLAIA